MKTLQVTKFYNTKKFEDLNKVWKDKLKESGFEDIEQDEDHLKTWHSKRFKTRSAREYGKEKLEYYRRARQFLHEYSFKNEAEYKVWKMHSDGISLADIDLSLGGRHGKANYVVRKLRILMKLSSGTED